MEKNKINTFTILYCACIANYVFSESQLVEFGVVNAILTISRYLIAGMFAVTAIKKSGMRLSKKYFWVIGLFIMAIILNMFFFNGGAGLLLMVVVVVGLYYSNLEVDKLIKVMLKTTWVCSTFVIMLCFCGILEDRTGIRYVGSNIINFYDGSTLRHTFGFLVANQVPLLLFITYVYLIMIKRDKFKVYEHLIFLILNVFFLTLFGSRLTFIMILATMVSYFIARIVSKKRKEKRKQRKRNILWLSYPICCLISIVASIKYNASVFSWLQLNNILMNRLLLSKTAINKFGITLFGSGNKVFNDFTVEGLSSAALDNGYVNLLLQRGIVLTILTIIAWMLLTYKAERAGNFYLVFCLCGLAISNLIDAHLTSYKMIPLFVLMFDQYSQVLTMYPDRPMKRFKRFGNKGLAKM